MTKIAGQIKNHWASAAIDELLVFGKLEDIAASQKVRPEILEEMKKWSAERDGALAAFWLETKGERRDFTGPEIRPDPLSVAMLKEDIPFLNMAVVRALDEKKLAGLSRCHVEWGVLSPLTSGIDLGGKLLSAYLKQEGYQTVTDWAIFRMMQLLKELGFVDSKIQDAVKMIQNYAATWPWDPMIVARITRVLNAAKRLVITARYHGPRFDWFQDKEKVRAMEMFLGLRAAFMELTRYEQDYAKMTLEIGRQREQVELMEQDVSLCSERTQRLLREFEKDSEALLNKTRARFRPGPSPEAIARAEMRAAAMKAPDLDAEISHEQKIALGEKNEESTESKESEKKDEKKAPLSQSFAFAFDKNGMSVSFDTSKFSVADQTAGLVTIKAKGDETAFQPENVGVTVDKDGNRLDKVRAIAANEIGLRGWSTDIYFVGDEGRVSHY